MTIWKFPLTITDEQTINVPKGAQILSIQNQFNKPVLYAIVNSKAPREERYIEIYGTGHPLSMLGRQYLGTFQIDDGQLVYHAFERNF